MEGVSLTTGAFYLLAGLAVLGAAGVAFSSNIIYLSSIRTTLIELEKGKSKALDGWITLLQLRP